MPTNLPNRPGRGQGDDHPEWKKHPSERPTTLGRIVFLIFMAAVLFATWIMIYRIASYFLDPIFAD